ncbi:MAG: helix-turn-helix domain-containing protein [Actinophytocola sp.]|uniref:helix-turn-helix domain-containing protein n=1 Tax=Actinophytocola sp. TaxID=1872138 RepID=UPI003C75F1BA
MRLRALLAAEQLGFTVLVGEDELDRTFERVFTATLRDPRRYLTGGELVLSGMEWWPTPADSEAFVAALAEADVAALCAGTAERGGGPVPQHVVDACTRHGVPLLEVPVDVSFATISEQAVLWLAAERAERTPGAGQFLDRYRRLVTAVAEGGGVASLIAAGARELGTDCRVLAATGRVVAGGDEPERTRLAAEFLKADRLPKVVPTTHGPVTLLSSAARAGHRMVSWFLTVAGDHEDWDSLRRELAAELATLVGHERARLDEERRSAARAAEPVLRLAMAEHTTAAGVAARLSELGLAPADPVCALSASVQGGSPGLAVVLLTELLAPLGDRATVAEVDGETVGVARISRDAGLGAVTALVADVRDVVRTVAPALGSARLSVGASRVFDAAALRSGLHEARHARKLAELSAGRATVVAGDDVASHLLLLAAVPEELRQSFRSRVLGPVLDYDAAHRSDLVRTLHVFLRHSGSWSQAAADLHVHVNTLRYRIGRVAELTGRDLSSFPDRVDLYLALDQIERDRNRPPGYSGTP